MVDSSLPVCNALDYGEILRCFWAQTEVCYYVTIIVLANFSSRSGYRLKSAITLPTIVLAEFLARLLALACGEVSRCFNHKPFWMVLLC